MIAFLLTVSLEQDKVFDMTRGFIIIYCYWVQYWYSVYLAFTVEIKKSNAEKFY